MPRKKTEFAKAAIWLEMLERHRGEPVTSEQAYDELEETPFWRDDELERATRSWKMDEIRRWMRTGPTLMDDAGQPIEMVNIRTVTEEGRTNQVYEGLPFVQSYDDMIQVCEEDIRMEKHFGGRFIRHHDAFVMKLPKRQATSFKKHFEKDYQRLLALVPQPEEAS